MVAMFGLIDAARDERLYPLIRTSPEHECLFAGDLAPDVRQVAPYLVKLRQTDPLWQVWRGEGWGRSWGTLCASPCAFADLRRHFRRFLQAMLPDGETVLFRFYDPRVFGTFIATCAPAELARWFACVDEFRIENANGAGATAFRFSGGALQQHAIA